MTDRLPKLASDQCELCWRLQQHTGRANTRCRKHSTPGKCPHGMLTAECVQCHRPATTPEANFPTCVVCGDSRQVALTAGGWQCIGVCKGPESSFRVDPAILAAKAERAERKMRHEQQLPAHMSVKSKQDVVNDPVIATTPEYASCPRTGDPCDLCSDKGREACATPPEPVRREAFVTDRHGYSQYERAANNFNTVLRELNAYKPVIEEVRKCYDSGQSMPASVEVAFVRARQATNLRSIK